MADEYIRREDAMWAACKALCHPGARCPDNCCIEVRKVFNAIPAADVAPVVRGRWSEMDKGHYVCSACNAFITINYGYKYCPNCGAKMDGGQDDA